MMFRSISRNFFLSVVLIATACAVCFGGYKAVKITYTISGSTGIGGVVMKGLPGDPVCDDNGDYSVTVDYGFKGSIVPTKEGYEFEPSVRDYTKVVVDQTYQDFSSSLIKLTISGSAGLIGAVIEGANGEVVSDDNGDYTVTVNYGWSGVLTPVKEGYDFQPQFLEYGPVKQNQTNQAFVASLKTFTISGSVALEGVTMKGFSDDVVTGSKGNYSVTVDYGWKGRVTAVLEGYTFDPAGKTYSKTVADHARQNYAANRILLTISGNAGLAGVVMEGLGDNTVSDAKGNYSVKVDYDFSGTVSPSKEGYIFTPGKIDYSEIKRDKVNERFTAKLKTFTISGSVGMPGVVMKGLTGDPVTDAGGSYSVVVNYGFNGVVVPAKEGYSFEPTERVYKGISAKQGDQDYAGDMLSYIVSGIVSRDGWPVGGVVLKGLPGEAVTNEDGFYSVIVDYGWGSDVTPKKQGHTFEPERLTYSRVMKDQPQDYEATLLKFAISGVITVNSQPLKGVAIKADNDAGNAITNDKGEYTIFVDYGFSGMVRPEKEGYTFEPSNRYTKVTEMASERNYSRVLENQINQDYHATILTFTIFGTVDIDGEPVESVLMTASNGGKTSLTDADGKYSITVDYGWTGRVSPSKEGYLFVPPSIEYVNVTSDIDQDAKDAMGDAATKDIRQLAAVEDAPVEDKPAEDDVDVDVETSSLVKRNLQLDVQIVVIDSSDLDGMGFKWIALKEKIVVEQAETAKRPWGIRIGSFPRELSPDLGRILGDLEKAEKANIVSSPEVSTREGDSTEIKITTEKYYSLDGAEVDPETGDGFDVEKVEYQTLLNITPHVSPKGDILLTLGIEVSEMVIRSEKSQVIARRVANDTIRIKDGGTVLIAGLKSNGDDAQGSENEVEEVAIFVTAKLLPK